MRILAPHHRATRTRNYLRELREYAASIGVDPIDAARCTSPAQLERLIDGWEAIRPHLVDDAEHALVFDAQILEFPTRRALRVVSGGGAA